MEIGNYNIEDILKAMYVMAKKCVSKVFTDRPSSTDSALKSFIVVKLPSRMSSDLVLGFTTAKFQIYVKDKDSGLEDTTTASTIHKDILAQLPCTIDDKWNFSEPVFLSQGSDGKGFHVYSITTSLIIL
jgi:hypothetical protein